MENNEGFTMNVNTNAVNKTITKNSSNNKRLEKKNKYLEKKLLNKKKQRDPSKPEVNPENSQNQNDIKPKENLIVQKKNFLDYTLETPELNNKQDTNEIISIKTNNIPTNNFEKNKNFYENKNKNFNLQNQEKINIPIKESDEKETDSSLNLNLTEKPINPENQDDLIDELNEFYEKKDQEILNKPKRLTNYEKIKNKEKVKEMQEEIKTEIQEIIITKEESKKEKVPIDFNSSVFSLKDFDDLDISVYLKKVLKKENLSIMTKIQKKSIPILLKHRDVVVKSETGSGKTLAYVIPIYDFLINHNISKNKINRKDGVYTIIFAPTHELCLQIENTFETLKSACINAVFGSLMGGQSIESEKSRLRKGLNIVITTPGRLLYHLTNTSTLTFNNLKIIVFDEADLLLNMGFEKDIKECMKLIYNKYQSQFILPNNDLDEDNEKEKNKLVEKSENLNFEHFKKFKIFLISATIDNKIRKMAEFLMKGFKTVGFEMRKEIDKKNKTPEENQLALEEDNETYAAPVNLIQEYSIVFDEFRLMHLICQIYNNVKKKIIVFVSNCDTVNFLQEFLNNFDFNLTHLIQEGEVGVGFNKYKNTKMAEKPVEKTNFNGKKNYTKDNFAELKTESEKNNDDPTKRIKLIESTILKLHGKLNHEERKKIFKEFNLNKPSILICTDVASRGLDFPHVDLIIHYDVNPDPKEYLNRMGRTARLDKFGNSILFLMKHEEKLLENSLKNFKINNHKPGKILLNFVENFNNYLYQNNFNEKILMKPQAYKDEVDENEKYRKKYIFAIFPLQKSIKDYLFKDRENLVNARKAFKSSIRSYVSFLRFQKDVFNARSFCLYKETSKIKVGNTNVIVDYEVEKKNTKGNKKFNNKKFERRLLISEFN